MAVSYASDDGKKKIPTFKSMDEWLPVRSTKIDVCARIAQHVLSRDDAGPVQFLDGHPVFPPHPTPDPTTPVTQSNKLVIFQEFVQFRPILVQVSPTLVCSHIATH